MKKELCFIIIDKEERVIKKDQNGMLCIFDTDIEANKFLRFLSVDDRAGCEIVKRASMKFEKLI